MGIKSHKVAEPRCTRSPEPAQRARTLLRDNLFYSLMALQRNREEVINTQLAILLSKLGVAAEAETIHVHGKHRPDVLFELRGLRVAIEGKLADTQNADTIVANDARQRVKAGIAHMAVATVYPKSLRNISTPKVLDALSSSELKYSIITEAMETGWYQGNPAALMDSLRHAQEALTKDDVVERTARELSLKLEGVATLWMGQKGACDRLSTILGIPIPKSEEDEKAEERRATAAKVSALVLANAFIFQEQLAATDERITTLRKAARNGDIISFTAEHWRWIWENINYVPIFQLGERILNELPSKAGTASAVRSLLDEATQICNQQAALRHDLMGRIYHWLLHVAKYLGTYYTSVSAATLLLKLAIGAKWEFDFGDPASLAQFHVGDLACGTGTLLMAAAQALSDSYINTRADADLPLDAKDMVTLHRTLMENVLYGYDVLPSAVHLTASTLALLAPEVAFVKMGLYVMPLGIDHGIAKLGSLDFLVSDRVRTQMALDYSHTETVRTGAGFEYAGTAEVPRLHLCVMNPPFVRSVGGNLLFGSLPDERGKLQTELKKRVKDIPASITAGLGSVFIALADRKLKHGGRLAFVIPAALISGEAWARTRALISAKYHLETVVSSHDAEKFNFSENTDLSEILFIARKLEPKEKASETTYINLWRNPRSIPEALDVANRILHAHDIKSLAGQGATSISGMSGKIGEMIKMPSPKGVSNWTGALFAQVELIRIFSHLEVGKLLSLEKKELTSIPIARLETLGALGPDRKRISEGFIPTTTDWTPYPGFWGHHSTEVTTIAQKENTKLSVWRESPRGSDYGPHLWERSGNILLVERLWPVTNRLLAIGFENKILGNTWWAFQSKSLSDRQQKALLLWLNSSLCLLSVFGRRVVTRGAWTQMKQPAWESMPVLDVRSLSTRQLQKLEKLYDSLSTKELQPLSNCNIDKTRKAIDDALSSALALPDLDYLRQLLSREPGLTAESFA